MSLLPGLRELRAPLVSGYLWLITAWLWLGNLGWLPSQRPSGSGEVARLWDLGGVLGTTVVLTAVTFIAYLIGSFVEIQPDGRVARNLTPLMLAGRTPEYQLKSNPKREQSFNRAVVSVYGSEEYAGLAEAVALKVAQSISSQARSDLLQLLERRSRKPTADRNPRQRSAIHNWPERLMEADRQINMIIAEMPQLASRLLVANKDLYGKYDRHMAESAMRINLSLPLALLLVIATWLARPALLLGILLTMGAIVFALLLFRQGLMRTVSARDVIVQALVIDEVQSRHIPAEQPVDRPANNQPIAENP